MTWSPRKTATVTGATIAGAGVGGVALAHIVEPDVVILGSALVAFAANAWAATRRDAPSVTQVSSVARLIVAGAYVVVYSLFVLGVIGEEQRVAIARILAAPLWWLAATLPALLSLSGGGRREVAEQAATATADQIVAEIRVMVAEGMDDRC